MHPVGLETFFDVLNCAFCFVFTFCFVSSAICCFFAFVLFLSYGVTNVLYYLALRGDLPPLELAVGLTVMKGEKSEESEERKEAKDKEEDNNEIPPLPSRAGRVSKTSVAAALPKSMFQNPMKHEGRELKEREEDDACPGISFPGLVPTLTPFTASQASSLTMALLLGLFHAHISKNIPAQF